MEPEENKASFEQFKLDFDSVVWEMAAKRGLVGTRDEDGPCESATMAIVQELLGISECLPNPPEGFPEEAMQLRFRGYLEMCQSHLVGRLEVDALVQAFYLARYRYLDEEVLVVGA